MGATMRVVALMKHHLQLAVIKADKSGPELLALLQDVVRVSGVRIPDFPAEGAHESCGRVGPPVVYLSFEVVAEDDDEFNEAVLGVQASLTAAGVVISSLCRVLSSQAIEPVHVGACGVDYDQESDRLVVDPSSHGIDDLDIVLTPHESGRTVVLIASGGTPGRRRREEAVVVKGILIRKP